MSIPRFPFRFGRYLILDRMSAGGMAEVYWAKALGHAQIDRLVAIKRMLPASPSSPQFVPMFIDEAKLVAQLSHPNIAQTYELGGIGQELFIAMELVVGRDLNYILKLCRDQKIELPIAFAAYVCSKTAEALDFAHRALGYGGVSLNLVHRDVSPHNILIAYEGQVKIVDFGIAKADLNKAQTVPGTLKGKLSYMAPEQALDGEIDRRTDIFSLGIVLWEILSGKRLFDGENALVILERICNLPVPDLRAAAPRVPEALANAVHRCLQRDAKDRFQNADEVVDALAPYLIEERTIFGERHAAALMRSLMPAEIDDTQAKIAKYLAVTEADCPPEGEAPKKLAYPGTNEDATPSEPRPVPLIPPVAAPGTATATHIDTLLTRAPKRTTKPDGLTLVEDADVATPSAPPPKSSRLALFSVIGLLVAGGFGAWTQRHLLAGRPVTAVGAAPATPPALVQPPRPEVLAARATGTAAPQTASQAATQSGAQITVATTATPLEAPPPAKATRAAWGFLTVRASTQRPARVFLDDTEIGYSPIVLHQVRLGPHRVKIVIDEGERAGATSVRDIVIKAEHERNKPLRLTVVPGT